MARSLGTTFTGMDLHRAALRELNELNAARIDSRFQSIDARMSETRHELRAEIATLRMEMQVGFARVESKIDSRFAEVIKWSFLFWCGTVAAGVFATRLR
jgi:hypothetical protein